MAAVSKAALELFVDALSAIRAWWDSTLFNKVLNRYGQGIQLSPQDIGALSVHAVAQNA